MFNSNAKLIASDSDIDKGFKSICQSTMTKIKNMLANTGLLLKQL